MSEYLRGGVSLLFGFVVAASFAVSNAWGQAYPSKPIRVIVGLAAGGAADVTARLVGQKLSALLGQSVIIENRPGAGGSIATERVVAASPDGYTLLIITSSAAAIPALRSKLPYDMERDLAPISLVASGPWLLLVHPSLPVNNLKELIALARSKPGKLNYGSSGVGGATHLAGEYLNITAGIKIQHIPYKGGAESAAAVAAGHVDITYSTIPSVLQFLEARKLKALAVTTATRSSLMPSIPTMQESGLSGFDYTLWVGLLTQAGVPKDIVARLNAAVGEVVNTSEMKTALNRQGMDPKPSTPEQFATVIRNEIAQNIKLVKAIGLKTE